jgi:hypothetical protein
MCSTFCGSIVPTCLGRPREESVLQKKKVGLRVSNWKRANFLIYLQSHAIQACKTFLNKLMDTHQKFQQ